MNITSLITASPYIIYTIQTSTSLQGLPTTYRLRQYLLGLSDPSFTRNGREARQNFNRKTKREQFRDIGKTETSSPATSCADSTAIDYRYKKIAGLIIPPEALKKGRHASHMCQQVSISWERRRTRIDIETENKDKHNLLVCPRRSIRKQKRKASTISSCAHEDQSRKER